MVCSLALSAGFAGQALAQDKEEDLEEILVEGKYLSIDKIDSVKTPTPIVNVPQSLSIVTASQIEDQAFFSLGDAMRYTPGVAVSQGEGHRDAIIIRGIQTTADFFVDGVRDDVQYYRPLYNVEQLEILRGPNALLFGRGGGGGVINRVQKKAQIGERFNVLDVSLDSFGAYNGSIDANFDASDTIGVRVMGYYGHLENHRDFYEGDAYAVNPTMTVKFGDDTTGTFSYEYVNDDRTVDRGVPSQFVANGPNTPLRGYDDTFFGSPDENFTTLEASLFRARLDHGFNDALRGNLTVQYADYDKLYQNLYASDTVVVVNGVFDEVELDGYRDTTQRKNLIAQGNLVGEFATGSLGHTLLAGFELGDQDTTNARFDNVWAANGDDQLFIPFTDPLQLPEFGFTKPARSRESTVRFQSLYLQDQIDLTENFKLLLGLRYDRFDIDVLDLVEAQDGDDNNGRFSRTDEETTPRFGLIYKPREDMSFYASYSETFLPRSGEQFLTLNLDSESTRPQFFENKEVGFKWDLRPDLSLTTAIFDLERESYTSTDPDDPEQLIIIEGSDTKGFEIQLAGALTDRWSVVAGYSYLDSKVKRVDGSGNSGNRTRQTPENMFSLWNSFDVNNRLRLGLGVTYQDDYFTREDNSVLVPSYTRVDAAAYYALNDRMRLQLNLENLLDEDYFPDAHSNTNITTGRPLNGRVSLFIEF
ncbi:MAG: TonB-dependent siderophore receptor [Xanthomonadales bacterium]|nr:TonB-dependent siderophore receptor [Xanthomonadales bacterium]